MEFVARHPKLFKTTLQSLKKTFDKYGEVFPKQENKARIEILTKIVKSGWIRTRYRPREGAWTVETHKWNSKAQKALMNWVKDKAKGKVQFRINFVSTSKQKLIGYSFSLDYLQGAGIMEVNNWSESIMKEIGIISESSYSRIWQHITDNDRSFAVISAYLDTEDDELNHKQLKKDIRKKGYGFIEMDSGYTYKSGDTDKIAHEKSYFIPEISKKDAIKLGVQYGQESILYKDSKEFILLGTRKSSGIGKTMMKFKTLKDDTFSFNKNIVKMAFSKLRKGSKNQVGRKFAFVKERRTNDFPTSHLYQGEDDVMEWIRIL